MNNAETHDVGFSSAESETLTEYQPFNRLAIASLLLGILSPLALAHPVFWTLPLVAVVISLLALRQTVPGSNEQRGRGLAMLGLACALFFGGWAVTWSVGRNQVLVAQARTRCEEWFDLVRQGRYYEAHQLTVKYRQRLSESDPIDELYSDYRYADQVTSKLKQNKLGEPPVFDEEELERSLPAIYKDFSTNEPFKTLISAGSDFRVRFEKTLRVDHYTQDQSAFELLFTVLYEENGQAKSLPINLSVDREHFEDNAFWSIPHIREGDESS